MTERTTDEQLAQFRRDVGFEPLLLPVVDAVVAERDRADAAEARADQSEKFATEWEAKAIARAEAAEAELIRVRVERDTLRARWGQ